MNTGKENKIINENIFKIYFSYLIPSFITFIMTMLNGSIDAIFAGKYVSSNALAGINFTIPIHNIFIAIASIFSVGGQIIIGQKIGENKNKIGSKIFTTIFIYSFVFFIFLFILIFVFDKQILFALGATDKIIEYSSIYLKYGIIFCFFISVQMVLINGILKMMNKQILTAILMFIQSILNIVLNYIFLIKLKYSIGGLILATNISFFIVFIFSCSYLYFNKNKTSISFSNSLIPSKALKKIFLTGFPQALSWISPAVILIFFNNLISRHLGTNGLIAFSLVSCVLMITEQIGYAISDVIYSLITINYGAKKENRVKKLLLLSVGTSFIVGFVFFLITKFSPFLIINIFISEEEKTTEIINLILLFILFFKYNFLFNSINTVFSSYFSAIQKVKLASILSFIASFVNPFLCLFLLPIFFEKALFFAMPLAEFLSFLIILFCYFRYKKS